MVKTNNSYISGEDFDIKHTLTIEDVFGLFSGFNNISYKCLEQETDVTATEDTDELFNVEQKTKKMHWNI